MTEDAPPSPRIARKPRWRRWLAGVLILLLVLILLPVCAWWWAGSDGSLAQGLRLAQRFLPEDQALEFRDAQGSITGGGSIAHLEWRIPGTALSIDGFRLDWSLGQLLHHALDIRDLHAGTVHVRLTLRPEAPAAEPFTMPAEVSLPITLTLPVSINSLQIESVADDGSSSTQVIDDLAARYRFDGTSHALTIGVGYGQSSAQAEVQLDAHSLALQAQLTASLRNLVPDTPFAMQLQLQADGNLGGGDAANLDLTLDASEITNADAGAELHAQAAMRPWAGQPAQHIELQFSRLNAHAFHDAAPITDLQGRASLLPVADAGSAAWDYVLDLTNDAPGAWDEQRLPLQTVAASGQLDLQQLRIETARVDLFGRSAAGSVTLAGTVPLQWRAPTLQLQLQQVDLQPLLAALPRTAISGTAGVDPEQLRADIQNTLPGPLDRERLPLEQLLVDIRISPAAWRSEELELKLGAGSLRLQGEFDRQSEALAISGALQRLPVAMIHGRLADGLVSELSGTLRASGNLRLGLDFDTDITGNAPGTDARPRRGPWEIRAVQASGRWSPEQLAIANIHLDAFQARVDGSDIELALPKLDAFTARIAASAPGLTLTADAAMPVESGAGKVSLQVTSAEQVLGWLRGLPLVGEHLPILNASGTASLQADWRGNWQDWIDGIAHPQAHPQLRLNASAQAQNLKVELAPADNQPPPVFEVPRLEMQAQGNLAAASVLINGDAQVQDTRASLALRAQLTQAVTETGAPVWNVAISELAAAATLPEQAQAWRLQLGEGLQITAQTGDGIELHAGAGSATLSAPPGMAGSNSPLQLEWQPLTWHRSAGATRLVSSGSIRGIQPAWIDALLSGDGIGPLAGAGLRSDLVASGQWDVRMTDRVDIRAHLQRDSGDVWLLAPATGPANAPPGGDVPAGIRTLDINVQSGGEDVSLALNWDTERAGAITAQLQTKLEQHEGTWALPDAAPLAGNVRAHLQDMGAWGFLTPPGWRVQGALDADITLAGTVQAPHLQGRIAGSGLNIRSLLDGVDLHDGTLRATLNGNRLDVDELTFQGGTGSRAHVRGQSGNRTQPPTARGQMNASGMIDWSGVTGASDGESGIAMDFKASFQKMQVLVRNDRQLSLSGELSAGLRQGALQVRGDLKVDRAAILLPDAGAPTLGDDVVVVRDGEADAVQAQGQLQSARPMDLAIKLDLGRDLALQGHGITTRLEGELTVQSTTSGNDPVSVVGEIRTDQGRYRAWGQALDVETGQVLFNGPYGNPSLNLLAIRPDIEVRAGVRVTGTLLAPQLRLFSEPDLPEAEKLSWVVLGRAPAASSAEGNSMQQAALGLLAGGVGSRVASGLGLDEVGLSDEGVAVGKRLGDELYVTYVAGLSGAASTLYLFYDITRRLTVRAQTGDSSAVDLIYTVTFD